MINGGLSKNYFIYPSAIVDEPCSIGNSTKIWCFSHIREGAVIGNNCVLGQCVYIGPYVKIGNNVHIQNSASIGQGATIENNVFIGPNSVLTNVMNPRAEFKRPVDEYMPILIKEGASIGANVTIICGNTIGKYAFIGAGTVVTHNVPDYAIVYGNPGRFRGWMCQCGEKLTFTMANRSKCFKCSKQYIKSNGTISLK